jgi:hypothetical protein
MLRMRDELITSTPLHKIKASDVTLLFGTG